MERVGVLIDKLQEQLLNKADIYNMLVTAQLLHTELLLQAKQTNGNEYKKVAVEVPNAVVITPQREIKEIAESNAYKPVPKPVTEPEPVAEPMPEPEAPMPEPAPVPTPKPEPEPIPHYLEQKPWQNGFAQKEVKANGRVADPVTEAPRVPQQEKVLYELNDTMISEGVPASINDKLKQNKAEMGSVLQEAPIRDLKRAISINDRHRFIHELFRGDETMYERSIKTINSFNIFAEAEFWIQRELKIKIGWDSSQELVKTFDQLVKRRFS